VPGWELAAFGWRGWGGVRLGRPQAGVRNPAQLAVRAYSDRPVVQSWFTWPPIRPLARGTAPELRLIELGPMPPPGAASRLSGLNNMGPPSAPPENWGGSSFWSVSGVNQA